MYYIQKTGLQKFLAIREFGGESRGNKAGFYCTYVYQSSALISSDVVSMIDIKTYRMNKG